MSMSSIFRECVGWGLYHWASLFWSKPIVSSIYFHNPSPKVFEKVLQWYSKNQYRFVSLEELKSIIKDGLQAKERVAFISFDDGWRSNIQLLPLCEKYNAPITVFVAVNPVITGNFWWEYVDEKSGRAVTAVFKSFQEDTFYSELIKQKEGISLERSAMTEAELKRFANHPLVTIQSHTMNHPILTNLSPATLYKELRESKKCLEEWMGYSIDVFSYPNGNVGSREIEALKANGYNYAFTTSPTNFDINNINAYLLPRMAMNTTGGKYENLSKIMGVWQKVFVKS